jgi:hypothetical protein
MKRFYIRFQFRNSGWGGVIKWAGHRWEFGNGRRATPVEMTEKQALAGLRSASVRSLRCLAKNEDDDLEVFVIEHEKGVVHKKRWITGALSAIAAAAE